MSRGGGFFGVAVCCAFLLSSCAFYDAVKGQEETQRLVAAQRAPASLQREEKAKGPVRVLRMRVYATNRYAASTLDWQHRFDGVVRDANSILRSDLGIELKVAEYATWTDAGSEGSLYELLARLETKDTGADVDWILALVTAVPGLAASPDELALAMTPGKHLVLRALSDPDEFDAIERDFPNLPRNEREKLYATEKRHKSVIVLLHELGHTLGIDHETEESAVMNARYSPRATAFSASAIRTAKDELQRREGAARASAAAVSVGGTAAGAPGAASGSRDPALDGLSDDERRLFYAAVARKDAGNLDDAWRMASPLFAVHEKIYAVQKLRCDLATSIGGAWENVRKECEVFMKLSP